MTASAIYTGIGWTASALACTAGVVLTRGPAKIAFGLAVAIQTRLASHNFVAKMFNEPSTIPMPGFYKYIGVTVAQGGMFAGAAYYVYNAKDNPVTLYNLKRIALFAPLVLGVLGSGSILAFGAARTAQVAAPIFWHFVAAPLAGVVAGALAARYMPNLLS